MMVQESLLPIDAQFVEIFPFFAILEVAVLE